MSLRLSLAGTRVGHGVIRSENSSMRKNLADSMDNVAVRTLA